MGDAEVSEAGAYVGEDVEAGEEGGIQAGQLRRRRAEAQALRVDALHMDRDLDGEEKDVNGQVQGGSCRSDGHDMQTKPRRGSRLTDRSH